MTELSLERGLQAFRAEMDAPIAAFFSSCVNCGVCAQACPFFVETQDPKYTPIKKLEPLRLVWEQEFTLWGRIKNSIGLSRKVTDEMLAEWEELLYDSCTMCARCSLVRPRLPGMEILSLVSGRTVGSSRLRLRSTTRRE